MKEKKEITMKHFEKALKQVRASVTKSIEKAYESIREGFTSAVGNQVKEEKPDYLG